jgi:PIN domain nuclease of toxin-antitoxin system
MLQSESGADIVEGVIDRGAMSTVNWSEVYQRSVARSVNVGGLRGGVEALGLKILPFTVEDAEQAGELWSSTRQLGLSLGDRACLALARRLGLPALTADGSWRGLRLDVEVQPIR